MEPPVEPPVEPMATIDPCCALRRAGRADERRERVIAAARTLFAERGFHATGIAEIARRSNVQVGQLYRDFDSKESIVAAIVLHDLRAFLDDAGLCDAIGRRDAKPLREWVRGFVTREKSDDSGQLIADNMAEAARNPRIAEIFNTMDRQVRDRIAAALAVLAPGADRAADREAIAELIVTLSCGLMIRRNACSHIGETSLRATLAGIVDRRLDALTAPAG